MTKEYYIANKDRLTARMKEYRKSHSEHFRMYRKEYEKRNPLRRVYSCILQRTGHRIGATEETLDRYARRGIDVCDEWLNDYKAFEDWCNENGYKKGLQIDRIDNSKGYCPSNCRFVTPSENSRNRISNHIVSIDGVKAPLIVFIEKSGLKYTTVHERIRRGWSVDDALKTKTKETKK